GTKNPSGEADPIIVHPDVRRMLLTQKAFAEGNRMLVYYLASQLDLVEHPEPSIRQAAKTRLDFMTPIAKAFATETGFESANLALQCFGGHGYIREWGVEQNVRDARIAMLYEGTTGVQALDLLSRKVLGSGGVMLEQFLAEVEAFCASAASGRHAPDFIDQLRVLIDEWREISALVGESAQDDPDLIGAASVNYLMYAGYVALAYFWARAATRSADNIASLDEPAAFYSAKIATARFYYEQILPRTRTCVAGIRAGSGSLMALEEAHFAF
ncbi:MAG: acyl-CoA dehydrogenase C-terminal domain-containing protein, partial [Pseudomonadota bacterium]